MLHLQMKKKNIEYKRKQVKTEKNCLKEVITLLFEYKQDFKIKHEKS